MVLPCPPTWSASLAGLLMPATRACNLSVIHDHMLPSAAESPLMRGLLQSLGSAIISRDRLGPQQLEGGYTGNHFLAPRLALILWLSEEELQLASVSKSMQTPAAMTSGQGRAVSGRDMDKCWT